jgi:hypothetical protein
MHKLFDFHLIVYNYKNMLKKVVYIFFYLKNKYLIHEEARVKYLQISSYM